MGVGLPADAPEKCYRRRLALSAKKQVIFVIREKSNATFRPPSRLNR